MHWIDPSTLKHCKAAIACARITGRHTYNVLAAKIESFHQSFGHFGKVSATVTDNRSNFIKAFASFVVPDVSSVPESSDSVEDDNELEEEEVTFVYVIKVMVPDEGDTQDDLTQIEYELPTHQRCAAHTLNAVASNDVDKFLSSSPLSRSIYRSSFGKCTALWNKASRSTVALDQLQEVLKRKLLVPSTTRWNAYYDAVERVVENPFADLNNLCAKLDLHGFNERKIVFLKKYCAVLKPLSRRLDILQGEDNCFYGTLLPTLETIIKKINAKKSELSPNIVGLVDSIERAIRRRFSTLFDSHDAIIAAVASPKFKFRWVEKQEKRISTNKCCLMKCVFLIMMKFRLKKSVQNSKRKEEKRLLQI